MLAATFLPARLPVDVNTVPIPVSPGLLPVCTSSAFADFTGSADERTQSIWRTDGTSAGTRKLADLGTITDPLTVECLTVHGTLTYFQFIGSDGIAELWRSDGTAAGTQRLLRQPDGAAGPIRFAGTLSTPFFVASLNNRGNELITTDGTTAGTRVVADIVPGVDGPNIGNGFAVLGGRLYFSVDNQLWRTDGTETGTLRITTLDRTGNPFAIIANIQSIDGVLYVFTDDDGGWSIWRSDGSAAGTTAFFFGDFATDGIVSNELLRSSSGALLFIRSQGGGFNARLWRTNGTTAGTVAITTAEPDISNIFSLQPLADGRLVFLADTARYGRELWITDGTDVGTRLVVDLAPGAASPNISSDITPLSNGFMFTAISSSVPGRAPWFSDGTAAGTYHLASLDTRLDAPTFSTSGDTPLGQIAYFWTTPFGFAGELRTSTLWRFDPAARSVSSTTTLNALGGIATYGSVNSRLLFVPDDPQLGRELWTSDGTAAGTRLLADLAPQTANGDSSPGRLTALGDAMLFGATDGVRARGLWRTDGTAAGTIRLGDGAPSEPASFPAPLSARLGNRIVYMGAATPNDNEVWITDGTATGSSRLTDLSVPDSFFSGGFANAAPGGCGRGFLELDGRVFFGATVNRIGRLYRTDGTSAGTQQVATFPFFSNRLFFESSRVCVLQSLSDWVFFVASSEIEPGEFLWRINAASGNAARVTSAAGRPIAAPVSMSRLGTSLLFHSSDGGQQGWWRISAATATPELFVSESNSTIGNRRLLTVVGNLLYFESCDGNGTCTLSRTDGTAAGTFALAPAELSTFAPPSVGVIGDRVVFKGAPDGELWITDGTTAGTRQLRDILPGAPQSNPTQFVDFRGLIYFLVTIEIGDRVNVELWRTDGTAANTERTNALPVQSAQFNTASFPFGMAAAGNRLFLPLYTVANGQELWNVENLAPTAQADTATTQAGAAVSVDVLANDTDEDGLLNRGSVRVVQAPASGTTQVDSATGAIRYTPASGFSGTVTFTYAVTDNQQRESAPGTVTVTVAAPPAPPSGGGGGGGGSWDWLSLLLMTGGLGAARRRSPLGIGNTHRRFLTMQNPKSIATFMLLAALVAAPLLAQTGSPEEQRKALLARAKSTELPGTWTPAPVTKLSHAAASYAQRVCSAVFIAGMTPAFAKATQGDANPLAPLVERVQLGEPLVNIQRQDVRVALPDGGVRVARRYGSQGCVILPEGSDAIAFQPSIVEPRGPATEPAAAVPIDKLDAAKLTAAIAAAFEPDDAFTQAFVVTWKGQVIGERYALGAGPQTPLEGWSMGKSVIATLLGTLMQRGVYTLDAPAPIPEWQQPGDPRAAIRIRDIMQMASGLRIRAEQDPEWVDDGQLADHWYY